MGPSSQGVILIGRPVNCFKVLKELFKFTENVSNLVNTVYFTLVRNRYLIGCQLAWVVLELNLHKMEVSFRS